MVSRNRRIRAREAGSSLVEYLILVSSAVFIGMCLSSEVEAVKEKLTYTIENNLGGGSQTSQSVETIRGDTGSAPPAGEEGTEDVRGQ